ncbi:MAG: Hsp20/alpha crystallin family protein [Candidatus Aminicenantales bacterium]
MIKRIRPIVHVVKIEGEIRPMIRRPYSELREILELQGGWSPRIDVYEKDDQIIVEAEVPGLSAREIVISLHMSRIEIKGLKKETPASGSGRYLRLEREYGNFQRSVPLPRAVDPDKARAYLENGVLTIRLKKLREAKDRDVIVNIQKGKD